MTTQIVGSKMTPADTLPGANTKGDDNYGRNQYSGPSSTTPGKKVSSNMLPQTSLAEGEKANQQTRNVGGKGKEGRVATHPDMRSRVNDK